MAEDMNKSAAETEEEYQPDLMTLEDEDENILIIVSSPCTVPIASYCKFI